MNLIDNKLEIIMDNYFSFIAIPKWVLGIVSLALIVSCSDNEPTGTDPSVKKQISFVETSATLTESSIQIELSLSQPLESDGTVTISIGDNSTATSSDYSTTPPISEGSIVLNLSEGMDTVFFTLTAENSDVWTTSFELTNASGGVELAESNLAMTVTRSMFELHFSENWEYGSSADNITALSEWERYSGEEQPIRYTPEGLAFTGYPANTGGAINLVYGPEVKEDIESPMNPATTGTIYSAQLVNASSASSDQYFFGLRSEGSGYYNRLFAQDDGSGNLLFGTALNRAGGGNTIYSSTLYDYNTTYLLVVKYDFETEVNSMYVFEDAIPAEEPDTPEAVVNTGDLPTSLDGVFYRQNKGALQITVDGLRIAKTWKDVLGIMD